jgi:AcrR family transcriptional regulator
VKTHEAPARRWARTDATQQRILDAATQVFGARGFTAATMADIVAASGASIGSIYHHFGGKKELFQAIFERLTADIDRRIAAADVSDPQRAFEAHARAYLQAVWTHRRTAMVLASGDVPAGFDRIRRASMVANVRRWLSVGELDTSPRGQLLTRILVAIMAESALMVAMCDDQTDALPIIDAAIEWIARLTD